VAWARGTYRGRVSDEQPGTPAPDAPAPAPAHPVLRFTALRILIFLATAGVLYLFQLRGFWLLLLSLVVSGVISAFALNRARESAAGGFVDVVQRVNKRIDDSARAEDGPVVDVSAPAAAADMRATPADDDLDAFEPTDEPTDGTSR